MTRANRSRKNLKHDSAAIREELLSLARKGSNRPRQPTVLGRFLSNFTSSKNRCFDEELNRQLRDIAPKWFTKGSHSPDAKKAALLEIARNGQGRPQEGPLMFALGHYVCPSWSGYDEEFCHKIKSLRPDWFPELTVAMKKMEVLRAAKLGEDRPSGTKNYINRSGSSFDPLLFEQIREIRPDWFKPHKVKIGDAIKQRFLDMAASGAPKPSPGRDIKLYRQWSLYVRERRDIEFIEKIRAIRPDWLTSKIERRSNG